LTLKRAEHFQSS